MSTWEAQARRAMERNLARLRVGQVWESSGQCVRILGLPEEIPFGADAETGEPLSLEVVRTEPLPANPERPELLVALSCFAYYRLMVDASEPVPA